MLNSLQLVLVEVEQHRNSCFCVIDIPQREAEERTKDNRTATPEYGGRDVVGGRLFLHLLSSGPKLLDCRGNEFACYCLGGYRSLSLSLSIITHGDITPPDHLRTQYSVGGSGWGKESGKLMVQVVGLQLQSFLVPPPLNLYIIRGINLIHPGDNKSLTRQ